MNLLGLFDFFSFDHFKEKAPFGYYRKKVRAALEAGRISEDTGLLAALRVVFGFHDFHDSDDTIRIMSIVEIHGPEFAFPVSNAREVLWLLERLEARQRPPASRHGYDVSRGQRTTNP